MATSNKKGKTSEEMLRALTSGQYKALSSLRDEDDVDIALLEPEERLEVIKAETIEYDLEGPDLLYRQYFESATLYDRGNDKWYVWAGNYWREREEDDITTVIHDFAESYVIQGKKKTLPLNNVKFFNEALNFLKSKCAINPDNFNPHGFINLTNGVLEIAVEGDTVVPKLHDHAPRFLMTQRPLFAYDPQAPTEDCDRFLTLLGDDDRELFMRIAGTALNPKAIAERAHRVPLAVNHGPGEAGKDALLQCLKDVLGTETCANVSMSDFGANESGAGGRGRFSLSQLAGAKLCSDSETTRYRQLDKLEVLKKAITHNDIFIEDKNTKGYVIRPYCVFIYNANNLPQVDSLGGEITSRFVVILFQNKYSTRPSDWEKGYLKADPLFAEDSTEKFDKVLPAFLNRMIDGLQQALVHGYNTEFALPRLEMMRCHTNHLARFAEDTGITVDWKADVMTPTRDIAVQLCHWYLANDYAEAAGTTKAMETAKDPFKELLFKPDASLPHDKVVQSLAHFGKRLQNLQGDITIGRGKDKRSAVRGLTFQNPFDLSKLQAPAQKSKVLAEADARKAALESASAMELSKALDKALFPEDQEWANPEVA
nr:hypothetical protein 3 [bacterium]